MQMTIQVFFFRSDVERLISRARTLISCDFCSAMFAGQVKCNKPQIELHSKLRHYMMGNYVVAHRKCFLRKETHTK